jgi:AcrR family transcriptional regulator
MSEGVKQDGGRGTRRAEQARATRRRIIDQAARLLAEQGYAATTLDQIAAAADVAVQTVYFHFRNKATVLKEVVDVLAVGDDEPVPVLDRPWVRRMRQEPDGARALAIWLRNTRAIFGRVAPVMKIVRDAAGSDPQMAAQWQTSLAQRYAAQRAVIQQLADKGALRPELTVDRAADIIFCLVSFEVYLLLTAERGWTPAQWERWITATLTAAILRLTRPPPRQAAVRTAS